MIYLGIVDCKSGVGECIYLVAVIGVLFKVLMYFDGKLVCSALEKVLNSKRNK